MRDYDPATGNKETSMPPNKVDNNLNCRKQERGKKNGNTWKVITPKISSINNFVNILLECDI